MASALTIQSGLRFFGYKGSNGNLIVADGDWGPNTDFAYKAFWNIEIEADYPFVTTLSDDRAKIFDKYMAAKLVENGSTDACTMAKQFGHTGDCPAAVSGNEEAPVAGDESETSQLSSEKRLLDQRALNFFGYKDQNGKALIEDGSDNSSYRYLWQKFWTEEVNQTTTTDILWTFAAWDSTMMIKLQDVGTAASCAMVDEYGGVCEVKSPSEYKEFLKSQPIGTVASTLMRAERVHQIMRYLDVFGYYKIPEGWGVDPEYPGEQYEWNPDTIAAANKYLKFPTERKVEFVPQSHLNSIDCIKLYDSLREEMEERINSDSNEAQYDPVPLEIIENSVYLLRALRVLGLRHPDTGHLINETEALLDDATVSASLYYANHDTNDFSKLPDALNTIISDFRKTNHPESSEIIEHIEQLRAFAISRQAAIAAEETTVPVQPEVKAAEPLSISAKTKLIQKALNFLVYYDSYGHPLTENGSWNTDLDFAWLTFWKVNVRKDIPSSGTEKSNMFDAAMAVALAQKNTTEACAMAKQFGYASPCPVLVAEPKEKEITATPTNNGVKETEPTNVLTKIMTNGLEVQMLQKLLNRLGYLTSDGKKFPEDGIWGGDLPGFIDSMVLKAQNENPAKWIEAKNNGDISALYSIVNEAIREGFLEMAADRCLVTEEMMEFYNIAEAYRESYREKCPQESQPTESTKVPPGQYPPAEEKKSAILEAVNLVQSGDGKTYDDYGLALTSYYEQKTGKKVGALSEVYQDALSLLAKDLNKSNDSNAKSLLEKIKTEITKAGETAWYKQPLLLGSAVALFVVVIISLLMTKKKKGKNG